MGEPLKPVGPQWKPASHQNPLGQNEVIDKLAERIADENDQRVRQRQREWRDAKREDGSALLKVVIFTGLFFVVVALVIISMASRLSTGPSLP